MKNLLSLTAVLSAFTWAVAYFYYHEGGSIHIFLGIAGLITLIRIIQEVYHMRSRVAKRTLVKTMK